MRYHVIELFVFPISVVGLRRVKEGEGGVKKG